MRLLGKFFSVVNISAAVIIFFNLYNMPALLKTLVIFVLVSEGLISLFGDMMAKVLGVVDMLSAVIIVSGSWVVPAVFIYFIVLMLLQVGLFGLL